MDVGAVGRVKLSHGQPSGTEDPFTLHVCALRTPSHFVSPLSSLVLALLTPFRVPSLVYMCWFTDLGLEDAGMCKMGLDLVRPDPTGQKLEQRSADTSIPSSTAGLALVSPTLLRQGTY